MFQQGATESEEHGQGEVGPLGESYQAAQVQQRERAAPDLDQGDDAWC